VIDMQQIIEKRLNNVNKDIKSAEEFNDKLEIKYNPPRNYIRLRELYFEKRIYESLLKEM